MSRTTTSPRVEARRALATRAILDSAWALAAQSGLEALSMRELASSVGMQAPSLYSYFPSKAAILDAMFSDGYTRLSELIAEVGSSLPARASARQRLIALLRSWIEFCQADRARYALMFTSAIPGWRPSETAYSASLESYAGLSDYLAAAGVTDPDDVDLCTALSAGLAAQQLANDPHGDRWSRRVDDVVDMFLQHHSARIRRAARLHKESS